MGRRTGRQKGCPLKAPDRTILAMRDHVIDQALRTGRPLYEGPGRPPKGQKTVLQALCAKLKMSRWAVARVLHGRPRDGRKHATLASVPLPVVEPHLSGAEMGSQEGGTSRVSSNPIHDNTFVTPAPQPAKHQGPDHALPIPRTTTVVVEAPVAGSRGLDAIGLTLTAGDAVRRPPPPPPEAAPAAQHRRNPEHRFVYEALDEALDAFLGTVSNDPAKPLAERLLAHLRSQ